MRSRMAGWLLLALLTPLVANADSFDVLAYNVQLLPGLNLHMDYLTPLLAAHSDVRGHDVVVFSEAFSVPHRNELARLLADEYPYKAHIPGKGSLDLFDSGVMILSKWPITNDGGMAFTQCSGKVECTFDCWARKGVAYARIVKAGRPYHVFGTHLDAGDCPEDFDARANQIFEMGAFIKHKQIGSEPVIMAGDFNVDKNRAESGGLGLYYQEYQYLLKALNAKLPFNQGLLPWTNPKHQWLDYVFYSTAHRQPNSSYVEVKTPRDGAGSDLSDHYALKGYFEFNYGAPPPPNPIDGGGDPPPSGNGSCSLTVPTERPVLSSPWGCFSSPQNPTFVWSPVARAAEYKLAIFDTTNPHSETLVFYEAIQGTSFTLPFALNPERRYRWKVKAQNCAGPGPFSDMMFFTLSSTCIPPSVAPALDGPRGCVDAVRPTFSWAAVSGATEYRIVVSPAEYDNFFVDQFVAGTSLVSPVPLDPKKNYRFKVRATNDAGPGPWSEIVYFTPFCNGVASTIRTPLGCTATQTPTFSWDAISHAYQYWLLVGDSPDFSSSSTTRYIDVHLTDTWYATPPGLIFTPGKTYYTKVKTMLDPASTTAGAWSPTVSFVPLCPKNGSIFLSQSVPASMAAGQRYNVSIRFRNTGTRLWTSSALYRLGPWAGDIWGVSRVELPACVGSDSEMTFDFIVRAPSTPGTYVFQWRMVEELVEWFGQATPPTSINVYAPLRNDASIVNQSVPSSMAAGQRYNVSIRMRNNGNSTWTPEAYYRLGAIGDATTWGPGRVELPQSAVSPDKGVTFDFVVRAPSTPGTYLFQWRVVEELVEWFGQSTPPLMINVYPTAQKDASLVTQYVPATMIAGGRYNVSIRMRNNGLLTWPAGNTYRLGPSSALYDVWGISRLDLPSLVEPNKGMTFDFVVTAPSEPGTYGFQWKMLEEFVEWFGQTTPLVMIKVSAPTRNAASFVSQTVPAAMAPGAQYNVAVTMRNQGTATWSSGAMYRLGPPTPQSNVWGTVRAELPFSVSPGGDVTFSFPVTAPVTPGIYSFQWQMIEEMKEWFGHATLEVKVRVSY